MTLRGLVVVPAFCLVGCSGLATMGAAPPGESGKGASLGAVASTSTSPSCAPGGPGLTNCGAGQESCCISLDLPGGTYSRTYTNSGSGPTGEGHPATVSGFRLDKYLVTVGRFRQFVSAWNNVHVKRPAVSSGRHTHLNGGQGLANSGSPGAYELGWDPADDKKVAPTNAALACGYGGSTGMGTWTPSVGNQENLPINCVNWWEAYAFCIWDGGFLPSEAEWEYAAAGGSQQREYPWGSTDPGTGNEYAIYGCYYPSGLRDCSHGSTSSIAPVGAAKLGAALWGQLDMAGNVSEWTLDSYAKSKSAILLGTYVDPSIDAAYLTRASYGMVRGGFFSFGKTLLLSTFRYGGYLPAGRMDNVGFRCARTP